MSVRVEQLLGDDVDAQEDAGIGALRTERGNLPLWSLGVRASITGLVASVELVQRFHNPHDVALEATYIFPLPDRAAVTGMRMEAGGRVVDAALQERGAARDAYDRALADGQRAAIAEEERPDVFTMRVGNILPGERASVRLTMVEPLPYVDGEAELRFPLVVAPRYIPGAVLPDDPVGDGWAPDTDAVPDASRITPPVLLPGFPNPVQLAIDVDVDPAGLPLASMRCSHAVAQTDRHLSVRPGERADRDFVLRLRLGDAAATASALAVSPDAAGREGTFQLTLLPPIESGPSRPRDVVLVLDRSGSMAGWKLVAARRAAARIVDTLTAHDRFAVLSFDISVERPDGLPAGLATATDRHRYRAVEHLARLEARGGTELLRPLAEAAAMLTDDGRDRVLVLVTDGQVGNEDQILRELTRRLAAIRVHVVGIDRAVNAGFLARLASVGGGRCELVESEDRLDEAATAIHRRIATPLLTGVHLIPDGLDVDVDSVAPARLPDLVWGAPLVVTGRLRGGSGGAIRVRGRTADGRPWEQRVLATRVAGGALAATWARGRLRDLEDLRAAGGAGDGGALERRIVETSLRFGVLCRFTAYVAIDQRVVTDGSAPHRVVQPVEPAAGWDMLAGRGMPLAAPAAAGPLPSTGPPPPAGPLRARRPKVAPLAQAEESTGSATGVREAAAEEAKRMRAASTLPPRERCMLLADLGTRLAALAEHLAGGPFAGTLRELAGALRACGGDEPPAGAQLDALWNRTLAALDELAAGGQPARRRHFWRS